MRGLKVRTRTLLVLVIGLACVLALGSCGSKPNSWINLKPPGPVPSARFGQALVYVADSRKLVMFGGAADEGSPLNDTWAYDRVKNTWTDLKPSGDLPPARQSMASAYDPGANKVVIFGGMGADGSPLNDTWTYDMSGNTWTKLGPSSPPSVRFEAKMVYDPATGRLITFGGRYLRTSASGYFQQDFHDLWAFDLGTDTWISLSSSGTPPSGWSASESMVYDQPSGTLLVLAGVQHAMRPSAPYVPPEKQPKDWTTWTYNLRANTWTENPRALVSPPISEHYALAFDTSLNKVVVFGGINTQDAALPYTWIYDPAANTWTMALAGAPHGPEGRVDHAMVYDPSTKTVIMFGGRSADGKAADIPNETWEYRP